MRQDRAIVVGGGIGGLAAALALLRRGWRVEVVEQAPEFGEVGAGVLLWPNGLRALDVLKLGDRVRAGAPFDVDALVIRDRHGRWLSRTDTQKLIRRHGRPVVIHRARLVKILADALPRQALRSGTRVRSARDTGQQIEVEYGGEAGEADLVVGADGIDSTVRRSLWPYAAEPAYAGYTAWRLLTDHPGRLSFAGETWGRGEQVGFLPQQDGRVYLFAVAKVPAGGHSPDGELAELHRRFLSWPDPIPALLSAARPEAVLRHDTYELPKLRSYVSGRACLLGDAAHAMTPNLGQGANQALEDAITLAAVLDDRPTIQSGLAAYDRARRRRTQRVARLSHNLAVVGTWAMPQAVRLRDTTLRLAPNFTAIGSVAPILTWQPPA